MLTTLNVPRPSARWQGALLLVLLTFFAYTPAMRGGFIWEDAVFAANPLLARPGGLARILTFQETYGQYPADCPMVYASFWLERRLWGLQPMGYHLVNVALHAINAILVWFILKKFGLRAAWLAAAIFALHPVHVESVAWITERKNVLSGLFFLLSLGAYLRFEEGRGRRWYFGSMLLFLLAILSKVVTSPLPLVLLLLRWERGFEIRWRDVKNLLPFFLLAAAMGIFTLRVEGVPLGSEFQFPWLQRVLIAGHALWFYPMKLAWPVKLCASYERWTLNTHDFSQWLWVLGALGAGTWIWRERSRLGRGFLAGIGFYGLMIAPFLGFSSIFTFRYSFVADRYQYLPSIGLIAIAVGVTTRLLFGDDASKTPDAWSGRRSVAFALGVLVLSSLGAATWRQVHVYRDEEAFWRDVLLKNPSSFLARNYVGVVLAGRGEVDEAIQQYKLALLERPNFEEAHLNLGNAFAGQGKIDEAIAQYNLALQNRPDYPEAHNNLGFYLSRQGKNDEAIRHYVLALRGRPDYSEAHNNLGIALVAQGKIDEAIGQFRQALQIDARNASARENLAVMLARSAHPPALTSPPDSAESHNSLGIASARQGKADEAIRQFRMALQVRPDFAEAHNNLGAVLAGRGMREESILQYDLALKARPDYAEAHNNLGVALAGQGRLDEAIHHFREALRIDPGYTSARDNLATMLKEAEQRKK